jgi:hypothetical protein
VKRYKVIIELLVETYTEEADDSFTSLTDGEALKILNESLASREEDKDAFYSVATTYTVGEISND